MASIPQYTRGDTSPALDITISDGRDEANFTGLLAADVRVQVERDGVVVVDAPVDTCVPAVDGKSARVVRAWGSNDLNVAGRHWVSVRVIPWDQTFPDDGPMRLDVLRAAGDA